jgi:crotonobetainyl-CoA:carnitine CoA-transferase CaiB-like acyl-CoA transferase
MKVFEGIRIVDFTTFLAGPYLCRLLADLGAEVIKVEAEMPETYRMLAIAFATQNRNKRSISLDLKKEEGKAIVRELVKKADIVVENARPGVMQRLGFDYACCKELNPDVIYVSASGFGAKGPLASLPGLDPLASAFSGQMVNTCGPDNPPIYPKVTATDVGVSALGAFGVAMALFNRVKTGKGQKVDTSLLHSAIAFATNTFIDYPGIKRQYIDDRSPKGKCATSRLYCGIDGKWFFVHCNNEEDWKNLCKTAYLEYLIEDPRFADPAERLKNDDTLVQIFAQCFALAYAENWVGVLRKNNVPAAPALYEQEIYNEPHFQENGIFIWQEHPDIERSQLAGFPAEFSNIENVLEKRAPLLGEHTAEILTELGYDKERIEKLKKDKVIFW